MKEIKLSKGMVAMVDDEDYDSLAKYTWFVCNGRKTYYAVRKVKVNGKFRHGMMHREIMKTPLGKVTDHIDHNGLNNQKSNLRICTHSENNKNRSASGTSKLLGVSFMKTKNAYRANIRVDGKLIYLGFFKNEIDAGRAYNEAAKMYHKEFANLNNI